MQISRMRLVGFKSFVEPTELRIEPGLTGIVGPNGCGKSNLLEAIRWVMGESRAKSMRGDGMDDVIFAGTETRAGRNFAEVALVCDAQGAHLPGIMGAQDGSTLEIVRRIERGAGSAYRANGQDVRARDITLIFADAATGAHSPALVSQGKVAAIIAAKPQERRQLLEEAAGIAGLHVRRKDAEGKLRATEGNLARLAELLAGMDQRAAALRRQARSAERYTRLTEQIAVAEGRMIYARWRDAAAAADDAKGESASAQAQVDAAAHAQQLAAAQQADAVATLATARDTAQHERAADQHMAGQIAQLRSQLQALTRQWADLTAEENRIETDRAAEEKLAQEGAAAIDRLDRLAQETAQAMATRSTDRPHWDAQSTTLADALRDAQVALAHARADAANQGAERRIATAARDEMARRLARIDADLERLARETAQLGDGAGVAHAAATAAHTATASVAALAQAENALATATTARAQAADALAQTAAAATDAHAAITALDSELAALNRALLAHGDGGDAGKNGGPAMIDQLHVDPGFEGALAAALGDDANAPLATGVDGPAMRGWHGTPPYGADPPLPAGATPLAHHVRAPPALARRLAQIGVVDAADGTMPLAAGQRVVTRDGRVARWDGFFTDGDGAATADRLIRRNRRDAIMAQLPPLRDALARATASRDAATTQQQCADAALADARRALALADDGARTARRAADAADAALARHSAAMAHIAERRATAQDDRADAAIAARAAADALAALPDGAANEQRVAAHAAAA
ncbi:MAG: AAA family ATPase, partial [Sphingopyxis sp.]